MGSTAAERAWTRLLVQLADSGRLRLNEARATAKVSTQIHRSLPESAALLPNKKLADLLVYLKSGSWGLARRRCHLQQRSTPCRSDRDGGRIGPGETGLTHPLRHWPQIAVRGSITTSHLVRPCKRPTPKGGGFSLGRFSDLRT